MNLERKYYIVDDNGTLYGHDLDLPTAENVLAYIQETRPETKELNLTIEKDDNEE